MVIPPEDPHLHHVIDTMALYVLDGGCAFEQAIMERGRGNPLFNFLFELGSKEHTYYVWRLYSFAQVRCILYFMQFIFVTLWLLLQCKIIILFFDLYSIIWKRDSMKNFEILLECRVIRFKGGGQNLLSWSLVVEGTIHPMFLVTLCQVTFIISWTLMYKLS